MMNLNVIYAISLFVSCVIDIYIYYFLEMISDERCRLILYYLIKCLVVSIIANQAIFVQKVLHTDGQATLRNDCYIFCHLS